MSGGTLSVDEVLAKEASAAAVIDGAGPCVVAYSGGVDSTLVAALAVEVLGSSAGRGALAVMGRSPAVSPVELDEAARTAATLGIALQIVDTYEIEVADYVANGSDRCYHCKTELYAVCMAIAAQTGRSTILNGTNRDDLGDHRPGLTAASEARVISPLAAADITKAEVRLLAQKRDLPNWDKSAQPCLASRLPYGTPVTMGRLQSVDLIEQQLRALGFEEVRARHYGGTVRVEVEASRVPDMQALAGNGSLESTVREAGFSSLEVEDEGFRSGRLNDALGMPQPPRRA